ncbi:MAG TPA: biotin--[acetyl-CoA-carboxylase] ligase [Actinomycetota bacterium]|nr:biotin--[acetyl-CoA-carboxylase] ligase [Actinomycetota bacterium]
MDDLGVWRERVRRALPGFFEPLEVVASLPSTMARAAELAAGGAPEGATVVAEEQTEGRGRLGRTWVAPPGSSLLLSVVLRPPLPREAVWLTVAAAGVALAGAVEAVAASPVPVDRGASLEPPGPPVGLKWPNDLELGGRKAAGLLAEAHLRGQRLGWVVLGMGVNVSQRREDLPPELADRATSVALALQAPVDRAGLLAAWAERFADGYRQLAAGEPGPVLAAYRQRLVTLGRRVRAERVGAEPVVGTAVDLTATGGLVVQTDTGARVDVLAADVHHLRRA